ncbi:8920_t:CDS:1, partial [Cetraspora pellucida]
LSEPRFKSAMAQTVAPIAMAQAEAMAFESQAKPYKPLTTLPVYSESTYNNSILT